MTAQQLLLNLPKDDAMGRADFLPSTSNAAGLESIDTWKDWPAARLVLTGPTGSGRSHLAQIWTAETGAIAFSGADLCNEAIVLAAPAPALCVDDADAVAGNPQAEEALFHLLNQARNQDQPVLMTARDTPGTWGLSLPDLESRMLACAVTRIDVPDDGLIQMVLVKLCDDHQLAVGPDVISYLAPRMDRSLRTARRLVAALDHAALTRQKKVTRALAAEILTDLGER